MKLAALLSGVVASLFAWLAPQFLADLGTAFLALWPASNSQQLFGSVVWQALCAGGLAGGLIAVLRPTIGGLLLLGAAGAWAGAGTQLPSGFDLQVLVPLILNALGGLAAFGAAIRGWLRRRAAARPPTPEEWDREQALRLEPGVELRRAVEEQLRNSDPPPFPDSTLAESTPHERASPQQAPTPWLIPLLTANLAVLLLLCGAVALLVYIDISTGQFATAFTLAGSEKALEPPAQAANSPVPQSEAAVSGMATSPATSLVRSAPTEASAGAKPPKTERAPGADEAMSVPLEPSRQAPDGPSLAEVRVSTVPLETVVAAEGTWTDPFAFCEEVGTIDAPDDRYAGPTVVAAISEALRVPASSDGVAWRCLDGALLACISSDQPRCAVTPSASEMVEYCTANPDAVGQRAPSGTWSCVGTRPVIPEGDVWPADERGFLPGAWVEIKASSPDGSIG